MINLKFNPKQLKFTKFISGINSTKAVIGVLMLFNILSCYYLNDKINDNITLTQDTTIIEPNKDSLFYWINNQIVNLSKTNQELKNDIVNMKTTVHQSSFAAKTAEKASKIATIKVATLDKKVNNKPIIEYTINKETKTGVVEFKNNGRSILKVTPHARKNINNLWRNIYNCRGSLKAKRVCVAMICAEHGIAQNNVVVDEYGRMSRVNGSTSPQMRHFNYGNIKCHTKKCNHRNCDTAADDGPRDKFVRYSDARAGLQAMLDFIQNGRYAPLWKKSKNDEVDIITGIDALGYATANYKELVVPYYTVLKDYK